MKKYKILLVDDDPLILKGVGQYLDNKGYEVTTADRGKTAVKLLESTFFDLVITDLIMEQINGIEVLIASRKANPESINVILTGYGDLESAIDALRLNADDYLLKPCDHKELELRVSGWIEKIELRKKLRRAEKELLQVRKLESLGILSGGLAHDFNNLLFMIMGNIELAKEDPILKESTLQNLEAAESASRQAQELTSHLITFSKGGVPVRRAGQIEGLIKETLKSCPDIRSDLSVAHDIRPVEFDKDQIRQAIKNIIINAQESMPEGGTILVEIKNFHSDSDETMPDGLILEKGNYVKISIKDQGTGIPQGNLSQIFDPYFSTKKRGTQKGMGLGLATVYSIINQHNGHICIESKVNDGTTITIFFPALDKKIPETAPLKSTQSERTATCNGKVLIMDDEELIRKVFTVMITRMGYEAESAADGPETVDLYKNAMDSGVPFDAVILDLTIRGSIGGKEVIKQLKEIDPSIKAIVSSGYSNDPVIAEFKKYGFEAALPKPVYMKDLKDLLPKMINRT